ncbi:BICD family-like cargo adapter 2 [Petaurus breviceps papuanus]|uniref:BICD family-like cargo adapter 2 n=1 Tax=Petaurus breviceps papuanus TaxID=3040969 RepID=UPI0036DF3740
MMSTQRSLSQSGLMPLSCSAPSITAVPWKNYPRRGLEEGLTETSSAPRQTPEARLVGHTGAPEDRKTPGQSRLSQQLLEARALGETEAKTALEQVTQERDDAIAKKLAIEAELHICRARLQAVEKQLLQVVKEKLRLVEEVEAWKDDMQELVSRQVRSQMQREGSDPWRGRAPALESRTQPGLTTHFSQWQWRWRRLGEKWEGQEQEKKLLEGQLAACVQSKKVWVGRTLEMV